MGNVVSVIKSETYEPNNVLTAVRRSFDNLGGIGRFFKPGQKVLLKPNLLMRKRPEEATTTHPSVMIALSKVLVEAGLTVLIADSPGGPFNALNVKGVYRACGMLEVAREADIMLNEDFTETDVVFADGKILKRLTVCNFLNKVDAVISVAKLKTHGMTAYSGAVKNLFGVVPGLAKAEYHLKMPKITDFSNMLVDICEYVHPKLSFIDGIVGMEGNGPSAGEARKIGYIFASTSPHLVDYIGAWTIGMNPSDVPTIARAIERGLAPSNINEIELIGDQLAQIKDYRLPTHWLVNSRSFVPHRIRDFAAAYLKPKPVFNHGKCVGCQDCMKYCPPQVIKMVNGKPVADLEKCIRCFCCQELCPFKAVDIKRPLANKLFRL